MPPNNIRKCLETVLSSLSQEDFDRFVNELVKREQEPRVLLNRVESKNRWQVVEVMIATFTKNPAVEVAVELLEDISQTSKAEELVKLARSCGNKPTSGSRDAAAGGPPPAAAGGPPPEEHFVDKHRKDLIDDLKLVDPILDVLRQKKVINPEMYGKVRKKETPQEQMRLLFDYLDAAGDDGKDIFLAALIEQQEFLYKKLLKK